MSAANLINPQRVLWEPSSRLPENCIISADSGTVANWFARDLKLRPGMKASLSGGLATMCPAVPYELAAKFAYPDRVAIGLVGDGAMQMLGNNSLIDVAKYWQRWSDPRFVIMVLNNGDDGRIRRVALFTSIFRNQVSGCYGSHLHHLAASSVG